MVNTCQKNPSLKECGIKSELTAAYSPQQNGVSKQLNCTLVEAARSMLSHADLSNSYWAEAVATATYLRNRLVSVTLKSDQTSYQLWFGEKPDLKHLRVLAVQSMHMFQMVNARN